jgi:acetyltransferase-like isoleucine patch superfamily enzyme
MFKAIVNEILIWIEFFLRILPGGMGNRLRRYWFSFRFKTGRQVFIESGCEFLSPGNMTFKEDGIIIGKNSFFTADGGSIEIGAMSAFNRNVHINADVGGKIILGEFVIVGPNVMMRTAGHRFDNISVEIRNQGHIIKDIVIGDNVWIAANVSIVGGVRIGSGAIIGAGAVVTNDIPAMAIAGGVPAKVIRFRYE